MSAILERATGPAIWSGQDFSKDDNWIFRLSPSDIKEIDKAVGIAKINSTPIQELTPNEFPLPYLGKRLQTLKMR